MKSAGLAVIAAIMIFIVGMSAVNLLKPEITTLTGITGLNCSNSSAISDGNKLTCLAVDISIPWVLISIIAVAGGLIFNQAIKGKK